MQSLMNFGLQLFFSYFFSPFFASFFSPLICQGVSCIQYSNFFYYLQTLNFIFLVFWANLVMIEHYFYSSIGSSKMITHVEGWGMNHEQMLMLEVEHVHLQHNEMYRSTQKNLVETIFWTS